MKGSEIMKSWTKVLPTIKDPLISLENCQAIRKKIIMTLKGIFNYKIDPVLPKPKLDRDELNAYKKTTFQAYVYELIFKESEFNNLENFLNATPNKETYSEINTQEFEIHLNELIAEVNIYLL